MRKKCCVILFAMLLFVAYTAGDIHAQTTVFKKLNPAMNRTIWNADYSLKYTFSWEASAGSYSHFVIKIFNNSGALIKTIQVPNGKDARSMLLDFGAMTDVPRNVYHTWNVYSYNNTIEVAGADGGQKFGFRIPEYQPVKTYVLNATIQCPPNTVLNRNVRPFWAAWSEFQDHPHNFSWRYGAYSKNLSHTVSISNRTVNDSLYFGLESDLSVTKKLYGGAAVQEPQELIPATDIPWGANMDEAKIYRGTWFNPYTNMVSWRREKLPSGTYNVAFTIPAPYDTQWCSAPPPTSTPTPLPTITPIPTATLIPTATPTPTPFCSDTDGTNTKTKGTLTTNAKDWTSPVSDTCAVEQNAGNYSHTASCTGLKCNMVEYYCDKAIPGRSIKACASPCSNGSCTTPCGGIACAADQICANEICRQPCGAGNTCNGAYHCEYGACVPGSSSSSSSSTPGAATATPFPSSAPDKANLVFKVKIPDIATTIAVAPNVKIQVRDGGSVVTETTTTLERIPETDFFKTPAPVMLDVPGGKQYTLLIKQLKTLRRSFTVTLNKGVTVDCVKSAPDSSCASLASPALAPLIGGDSDGFNDGSVGTTRSESYNKIDTGDLGRITSGYQARPLPLEPNADFNLDGKIDILDLGILGKNYGKKGE